MRARTFGYTFEQPGHRARALNAGMKALIAALLLAVAAAAQAQPRVYGQADLDALLAPVALYPDPLLSQVLVAATYPEEVREAAAWSRANAHLKGDEALRAAQSLPWDPSVKALLAYPDLLARMDESPQWTFDLGQAFLAHEPQVMETVQELRRRAQASGHLQSDGYQTVHDRGTYVAVQPVYSSIVYVPWYNPLVVYGPWWWHSHRPIAWRPWHARPVSFVSVHVHRPIVDWHRRHVHRPHHVRKLVHVQRPVHVPRPAHVHRPAQVQRPATVHNHVHQAQTARPVVESAKFREHRPEVRGEHRSFDGGEHRSSNRGKFDQGNRRGGSGHSHSQGRNRR
jgi:hypothetical protein